MYWVVAVGLAYGLAVLVISLAQGRQKPRYFVPWVIAIVVLSVDTVAHVVLSIGVIIQSPAEGSWVGIAALAFAAFLVAAILQPRLAGWTFASTALVMPVALFVVESMPGIDTTDLAPMPAMLGFYAPRALIVGGLLFFSMGWKGGLASATKNAQPSEREVSSTSP